MSLASFEDYMKFVENLLQSVPENADTAELENILVSHGVVVLYARMEQCVQQAIEAKCKRCNDDHVRAFALSVKKDKTGKLGLEAIKGTLSKFGIDHRKAITPELNRLNIADSWDSIVALRQNVAHYGRRASLTRRELMQYYGDIRKVLGCICAAMTLDAAETAAICPLIEIL